MAKLKVSLGLALAVIFFSHHFLLSPTALGQDSPRETLIFDKNNPIPTPFRNTFAELLHEHKKISGEEVILVTDAIPLPDLRTSLPRIPGGRVFLYLEESRLRVEVDSSIESLIESNRRSFISNEFKRLEKVRGRTQALGLTIVEILKDLDSPLVQTGFIEAWIERLGAQVEESGDWSETLQVGRWFTVVMTAFGVLFSSAVLLALRHPDVSVSAEGIRFIGARLWLKILILERRVHEQYRATEFYGKW